MEAAAHRRSKEANPADVKFYDLGIREDEDENDDDDVVKIWNDTFN